VTVGRDAAAAAAYRSADRAARRDIVRDASCDTGATFGYMRRALASGCRDLARVRVRAVRSRKERLKRKSDFFHVLSMQAERLEIVAEYGRLP